MSFTRSEMKETSKGRTRDSSNHHHNHNHNHRSSSKDSRSHRDVTKGTTAINGHDHRSDRSRRDRPQVALPSSTAILKSSRPQPHHSITASITGLPIRLPSNGVKLTKKERDRIRHRIRYAEQKLAREAERMGGVSSSSKLTNGLGPGAKGAKYSGSKAPLPTSNGTASASNSSSTSTSQHSHHKRAHVSTAVSSSSARLNGASSTRSTMSQPMTKSAASSSPSPSTSKPYHPSRPSTSNNNMDATPPRQHPQHPTTAMKGPKTQLFPPSYLNGLESSTDMDAWLPPKYHDDEEYKAEVEAANARHSAKCLQTCTPAIYNGITDLQLLLERHCVQLEERRYQLREEKRAWSEFRRGSVVKETGKIKRSKKDSAAWFLEHYKPPTRQSERPPPGPSPDSPTGIEALSRVENFFTASSSLLLTTVASCSLLGASTNLSDRAMRKVERSKRMLVVVPAPQQQAYFSGELNPLLAKLNADFERLFAEKLVLEKHYSPLAEYIGQSKFTDLVRQVLAGGRRAEETTAAEDEPVTLRCSARIRRNQSVEEMLPGSPVHPVHLRNGSSSSSPLKRPPPAVLPASPSRPKNGFKVPRLNGYLGRSPHHYSTASSSLESSPGASPPSTTTEMSAPPSPTALYKDLVEFTGALTRSQIRSLQDTTRAMSSEARLVRKGRRGPSAKESNSTAASPEEPDPFEVIDVQLKANMKKNRDMLRLLDEHVFLFAPRCDGNGVKSRSELAKSTRGSTKSRPKSEANSKRSSLRRRGDPGHSSSDSKDSTLMRPPMTPATPTPTSSPTISPSCPLTRGRKRSRTDSVDTTDQHHQQQQSTFWSGFWADEEAKYDSTASRAERAVPNPTLEDELDCEGWEMSLELPRASTKYLEAILARTVETVKESTINKCRGGREMTTVATINSPLAMVLEEGTDRRRFLPQADDPRAYLKTDPLFGLELLGDQPVSSSSRRGSLEPIESGGHEDSTEEATAALNGQPKDELKESLQVLLSELESLTAVNTAHLGYISDQVLHDLRLQELRASAENLHVEVLDMFVGKLNRRSSNPLEPAAKRRIEEKLDELLRVKRQMDAILAAQGAKGAIAEVFQCQQSLNIAKQQQSGGGT